VNISDKHNTAFTNYAFCLSSLFYRVADTAIVGCYWVKINSHIG